jgi:hypothetical protein
MREGMARGELRPMDPQLGAAMMIGLLLRTVFFLQRGIIEASPEETLAEVCGAVQRIFLPRQGSRGDRNGNSTAQDRED